MCEVTGVSREKGAALRRGGVWAVPPAQQPPQPILWGALGLGEAAADEGLGEAAADEGLGDPAADEGLGDPAADEGLG